MSTAKRLSGGPGSHAVGHGEEDSVIEVLLEEQGGLPSTIHGSGRVTQGVNHVLQDGVVVRQRRADVRRKDGRHVGDYCARLPTGSKLFPVDPDPVIGLGRSLHRY